MNLPGPMEAVALIAWCFMLPMVIAMGWHCGRVWGAILFGATKSTTDVKIADIKVTNK